MRGSGASPDSAIPGSNRRAQAIHGLLAPDPRTTASFARWVSVASSIPAPACPAEAGNTTPRRTSLQGVRVRVVHGCTTPACWSRTRNHAANANPLQRRPPPEAEAFARHHNQRRPRPKRGSRSGLAEADPCFFSREKKQKKGRDIMSRPWRSHSAGRESASGRYGLTSKSFDCTTAPSSEISTLYWPAGRPPGMEIWNAVTPSPVRFRSRLSSFTVWPSW